MSKMILKWSLAGRYTYSYDDRYAVWLNFGDDGLENFNKWRRYGSFAPLVWGESLQRISSGIVMALV
ncbi:hypothetical protein [Pedobacter sp. KLB.chiD]|uniref:hypothetical protein n=1 Tax=Pedobacter sp. KLB.chiD TaxID=3387402 RepID=UPI00399A8258